MASPPLGRIRVVTIRSVSSLAGRVASLSSRATETAKMRIAGSSGSVRRSGPVPGSFRQLERVLEEVAEDVRFVPVAGAVAMGPGPGDGRLLEERILRPGGRDDPPVHDEALRLADVARELLHRE